MAFDQRVKEAKNSGFTFRGQPITLSKTLGRPREGLVAMGTRKGIWPEAKKIEVATLYAVTGNFAKTAELAKIPEHTVRSWRKQEWFRELLAEIREENNDKVDAKFSEIIEKSLDIAIDRLEHGDFILGKDGELRRKPVGIRDLSIVNAISVDKRQILRGLPTSRVEQIGSVDNKLQKLAEAFVQLANKQPKAIDITSTVVREDEPVTVEVIEESRPAPEEAAGTNNIFQKGR